MCAGVSPDNLIPLTIMLNKGEMNCQKRLKNSSG